MLARKMLAARGTDNRQIADGDIALLLLPVSEDALNPFQCAADSEDIRPLEIAIINLMADKISTERQLALWLGNTMLQVNLTFLATDSYASPPTRATECCAASISSITPSRRRSALRAAMSSGRADPKRAT
jgi:hypothetical protein